MKKLLFAIIMTAVMSVGTACAAGIDECEGNQVKLQIDNPMMNVCGVVKEVDEGRGTVPMLDNGHTLVPIRAIIEAFGGYVGWEEETSSVYVELRGKSAKVTVDSPDAVLYKDGGEEVVTLSAAPKIVNGRTMLPLRFISESVGLTVDWNGDERVITITLPKSAPVSFANVGGEFYPIGDLLDVRIGAKDMAVYSCGGEDHMVKTNIVSTETVEWELGVIYDFYDPETSLSSITVDGTEFKIPNVFNLEYVGVADLSSNADGFEIVVVDSGVSDDYSAMVLTYNDDEIVCTNIYGGMTYDYYANGTGTVYCDGKGNFVDNYIGFTEPMYAFDVTSIRGGKNDFVGEVNVFEPDVIGKELVFGRDLFAYYIEVDEYPQEFEDVWSLYSEHTLKTVKKGTPVIVDDIKYWYDEETGERYLTGYYARVNGKKCVIQLQYAG